MRGAGTKDVVDQSGMFQITCDVLCLIVDAFAEDWQREQGYRDRERVDEGTADGAGQPHRSRAMCTGRRGDPGCESDHGGGECERRDRSMQDSAHQPTRVLDDHARRGDHHRDTMSGKARGAHQHDRVHVHRE